MEHDKERRVVAGTLIGMIIGFLLDIFIGAITTPMDCSQTKLQDFFGLECIAMGDLYGLFIWLGSIGGFIGYFTYKEVKRRNSSHD